MTKEQIIDYVMNSPANTNPNVLGSLLDGLGGIVPTKVTNISSNGTFDVTDCATANVDTFRDSNITQILFDSVDLTELSSDSIRKPRKVSLSYNVKKIGSGVFANAGNLETFIGQGLTQIGDGALYGTASLKYVYLGKDVTSIGTDAFNTSASCVIDCGFAEGAVGGAPWGATNATINYNVHSPRYL